jgi:ketosteroid isomerase-like protein
MSGPESLQKRRLAADMSAESLFVRNICFLMLMVGSASPFAASQSGATDGAITIVLALEHAWNQAEQRNDTKALDAIFDNALVYVDYDGSFRTKAEFLSRVKAATLHPEQEVTESMTARLFGTTVVVTGIYIAKGMESGKPYLRRGRFVDTWTFENGKWLCVASQATPILR